MRAPVKDIKIVSKSIDFIELMELGMIKGIGLQNFRSFVNKTFIDLKPITVFVGKNSSGKSSLLRTFPLLRQSVEENTTGPILWYGRYVDFGDFTDVLSRNSEKKEITFSFSLSIPPEVSQRYTYYRSTDLAKQPTDIEAELTVYSKDKKTKTKTIKLILADLTIFISMDESSNVKLLIESDDKTIERDGIIAKNLGQARAMLTPPRLPALWVVFNAVA